MSKEFARIVVASDGHQVLFYTGTNDDNRPVLNCISQSAEGTEGNFAIAFESSLAGDDAARTAMLKADQDFADKVRAQMKPFFEPEF